MKHIDKLKKYNFVIGIIFWGFVCVLITLSILLNKSETTINNLQVKNYTRYTTIDGSWTLDLFEDGSFQLQCQTSSSFSCKTVKNAYKYKDDMLILKYTNGAKLSFSINEEEDTLSFQKKASHYTYEMAQEIWGVEPFFMDDMVFSKFVLNS